MQYDIGAKIRQLRLASSMTQEQLADRLGLSAQAVSKWEQGVNMPDILMLPQLSVIFGITIDELFDLTDQRRLERIENAIYNVRFLSERDFRQYEQYLKDYRGPEAAEAGLLLAMLYNKRAQEYRDLASPLARGALTAIPGRKEAHKAVFDAENGAYQDWNCTNNRQLIDFYKAVTVAHPEDIRNYFWLLDLLIADGRTAEARDYAEQMKALEHSYHYELYMGSICRAECDLPGALGWWADMTRRFPEKWQTWFCRGSELAKLGRYAEALASIETAMDLRPHPRFIDCEDAASQIQMILGNIPAALQFQRQMKQLLISDWSAEGETMDKVDREIQRLEQLLAQE